MAKQPNAFVGVVSILSIFFYPIVDIRVITPTVSLGVTCAVVYTYGCDDGRIAPTRCAIIAAGLDGR